MKNCLARTTRAHWYRSLLFPLVVLAITAGSGDAATRKSHGSHAPHSRGVSHGKKSNRVGARSIAFSEPHSSLPKAAPGSLEALSESYRGSPSQAAEAALMTYAHAHAGTSPEGLAYLALSAGAVEHGSFDRALENGSAASKRVPELADYAAFFMANAYAARKDAAAVSNALKPVWKAEPESPLRSRAAVLEARTDLDAGQAENALKVLDKYREDLAPASSGILAGRAYEALGRIADAARKYQKVFYDYPFAPEAAQADAAITRLRGQPGYPPPDPAAILRRGQRLIDAGEYSTARRFLENMLPRLDGEPRDAARVRLGAADFFSREETSALSYLKALHVPAAEADAERLFYVVRCAQRLDRGSDIGAALDALRREHPDSPWRERALIAEGNRHLVNHEVADYMPLFRACYESFPDSADAAYCHWRVVWEEYLENRAAATPLLQTHLVNYPTSPKANAALYFLGRIAESKQDAGAAHAWYSAIVSRYPNSYYAILARTRLGVPKLGGAVESPAAQAFLAKIPRPTVPAAEGFDPDSGSLKRIGRARLLASAGLYDYAEGELRFGAETGKQPQVIAIELAGIASTRDAPDQAIRYIKHYVPNYLNLPLGSAPEKFWQLAFPLPYRHALEQDSLAHGLDPYLVAALIRQESEFNPRAVSVSRALGLAQVMPSTGRQLSRRLGIPRFRPALLFQPDVNLKIGTYYLRALMDGLRGSVEAALASYNAGKSRADAWQTWANFEEPAEFVESIPFSQTRDYVEIVLHNADVYRRLYALPVTAKNRS